MVNAGYQLLPQAYVTESANLCFGGGHDDDGSVDNIAYAANKENHAR